MVKFECLNLRILLGKKKIKVVFLTSAVSSQEDLHLKEHYLCFGLELSFLFEICVYNLVLTHMSLVCAYVWYSAFVMFEIWFCSLFPLGEIQF